KYMPARTFCICQFDLARYFQCWQLHIRRIWSAFVSSRLPRDSLARVADIEHEIAHQLIEDGGILEIDRMPASGNRSHPRIRQRRRERPDDRRLDERVVLADQAQNRHRAPLSDRREIVALAE